MMNNALGKKENFNAVDIAKFILAFGVVSIHTFYNFVDNPVINSFFDSVLIRLSVPFFFVCSGFFFFRDIVFENGRIKKCPENRAKLCSFLKRMVILYCIWTAIYMVWNTYVGVFEYGYGLVELIKGYILDFFLCGVSDHFWYILFMIYSVILLYISLRFIRIEIVGSIVAVLLLFFFYGYTYIVFFSIGSFSLFKSAFFVIDLDFIGTSFRLYFIYLALGLLLVGLLCLRLRDKISLRVSGLVALISLCLSVAENAIMRALSDRTYSYTIFLVPTVMFGFIFLSKLSLNGNPKIFAFFRKSSTIIYCSHLIVKRVFNYFTDERYNGTLTIFLVVCAVSIALSLVIVLLSGKIKFFRKLY